MSQPNSVPAAGVVLSDLAEQGWSTLTIAPDVDLRGVVPIVRPDLSERLFSIQVERISPKHSNQARPGTMSAIYGLGPFPLHTERAHWRVPPRYLIFRSVGEINNRPTTLLDSYDLILDKQLVRELLQAPWLVQWGNDSFLSPVLRPLPTSELWQIRYDRCCMTVLDGMQKELGARFEHTLSTLSLRYHYWQSGNVLLIDNRRMLHGRGASTNEDLGRVLERIVVP
jgi:L-asparagine oxygenase